MSYQTQAAIGPYPVNCLLQAFMLAGVAVPRLTGIAAIDDVLPVPLSICRLIVDLSTYFVTVVCHCSGCQWLVSYSLVVLNRGLVAIAIGSRDTFDYSPAMTVHCTGLFFSTIISLADSDSRFPVGLVAPALLDPSVLGIDASVGRLLRFRPLLQSLVTRSLA
jgi:hypothetical protein